VPTALDNGPWRHFYRLVNPVTRALIRHFSIGGPSDDLLRVLRVRGRISGRPYDVPVRINTVNGDRHVVAMFATAQWVNNLRATGTAEVLLGNTAEHVNVHELHGDDKSAFINTYISEPKLAKRIKLALRTDPEHLSADELQEAINELPVFRLESAP
jgi:hypothetical protein